MMDEEIGTVVNRLIKLAIGENREAFVSLFKRLSLEDKWKVVAALLYHVMKENYRGDKNV